MLQISCADYDAGALVHESLPSKWMCSESRDFFKFWQISDNISITVQDIVAMKH